MLKSLSEENGDPRPAIDELVAGDDTSAAKHRFIMVAAELLHRNGTPSHRLERVMDRVAASLRVPATFLYTPTSLFVSFGAGDAERTRLIRIDAGDVELGKLIEFDDILEQLDDGKIELEEAYQKLMSAAEKSPRFGRPLVALASGVASGGAAVFFGGGFPEVVCAFVLGCVIHLLGWLLQRTRSEAGLFEPLAGFITAFLSMACAQWVVEMDDRVVTLASLIILIPGLSFTIAMSELAARHLNAGVARMAGAGSTFLILAVGVALAWRLGSAFGFSAHAAATPLPDWATWAAVAVSPFAFAILFQARLREWWVIYVVSVVGFVMARLANGYLGGEFGPFMGALGVGIGSNLYARVWDRPGMIPQLPSTLILVPGSLGYLSLTSFIDHQVLEGVEFAFSTAIVAVLLVGGSVAANAILSPKRAL